MAADCHKIYATRHISSYSGPDAAGDHCPYCPAGDDAEFYCGAFRHDEAECIQAPSDLDGVRPADQRTSGAGNLLSTRHRQNETDRRLARTVSQDLGEPL